MVLPQWHGPQFRGLELCLLTYCLMLFVTKNQWTKGHKEYLFNAQAAKSLAALT